MHADLARSFVQLMHSAVQPSLVVDGHSIAVLAGRGGVRVLSSFDLRPGSSRLHLLPVLQGPLRLSIGQSHHRVSVIARYESRSLGTSLPLATLVTINYAAKSSPFPPRLVPRQLPGPL